MPETETLRGGDCLGARRHSEGAEHGVQVLFDGAFRDLELAGDLAIVVALLDQRQDFQAGARSGRTAPKSPTPFSAFPHEAS